MTSNFEEHEQLSDFKTVLDKQLLDNSPIAPTIDTGNPASRRGALQVAGTAFVVLFCIVGLALWGLPFYYDFMVQQFGWTRGAGNFGKCAKQIGGGTSIRIYRRMDHRSLWSAPRHDGWHSHGGWSTDRAGLGLDTGNVLFVLFL